MAKAFGRDPTNNLYAVLLQKEAYGLDEETKPKVKKTEQPAEPTRPPGYIPTPAERGEERKKKEDEKKRLAEEQQKLKEEKEKELNKKKKAETEFQASKHKSEKLSREQWEIENKKKKLQQGPNYNNVPVAPEIHPVAEQPKPQQPLVDKDGFQPARSKNQHQYQQQLQQQQQQQAPPPQQQQQQQPFQPGQGYRGRGGKGRGGGEGRGGEGRGGEGRGGEGRGEYRGSGEGRGGEGRGEYRVSGEGRGGEGRGEYRGSGEGRGGEGRGGEYRGRGGEYRGRGGRNNNRRGRGGPRGSNLDNPPRFEENQNREFNQRGQDLSGERPAGKRPYDRKSGRYVKNISNINVNGQEGQQWYEPNPSNEPTTEVGGVGWGDADTQQQTLDTSANNAEAAPQEGGDDWASINQGTAEAAPTSPPGANQTGDKTSKPKAKELKGLDDYWAEQKKKKEQLDELLAQMAISSPAPRVVEADQSGGRYVDVKKNLDTAPPKKKEEKPPKARQPKPTPPPAAQPEPKPTTTAAATTIKVEDIFNFNLPKNETRRRFNQDSELSEKGDLIQNTANTDQPLSESNNNDQRRPKGARRGGRGGGRGGQGGRGRGNRRAFNTSGGYVNRGNGGNLLPTDQPDDWPALV